MPLDPSFRTRLREALQHSRQRGPSEDQASDVGLPTSDARQLQYETEEERQHRVDAEQSAWIADALGGWWQRDGHGVCLVVDREYAADRTHGEAQVGYYAETLSEYQQALYRFDTPTARQQSESLFTALDEEAASAGEARVDGMGGHGGPPVQDRLLFFDLETTGLSGGAGTCAFLVGFGWFDGQRFRTRQYFLSGFGHEAAMLRMVAQLVSAGPSVGQSLNPGDSGGTTLATFNGRTFDVPLIGGRYLYHRLASPFDDVPHLDLLHPARRLWRYRSSLAGVNGVGDDAVDGPAYENDGPHGEDEEGSCSGPPGGELSRNRRQAFERYFRMTGTARGQSVGGRRVRPVDLSTTAASCALGALEEAILGFRRHDDVPGADIPTRYFHYVRSGDVHSVAPVLEHNRLDLLSLAAVASVVARMLEVGPQAARTPHECLALGRLYERAGSGDRATVCYERAVDGTDGRQWSSDAAVQREALRRLAMQHRRERRYEEAASAWQRLLDLRSAHSSVDFEALHALAVHHEHRSKDLATARHLVMRALADAPNASMQAALRHRLERIERKLAGR